MNVKDLSKKHTNTKQPGVGVLPARHKVFGFCFRWTAQSQAEPHRHGSAGAGAEEAAIQLRGGQDGRRGHSSGEI